MRFDTLLDPISDDQPCGPDLEQEGDDAFIDYYYDALARLPERYADTSTGDVFDRKGIDLKAEAKTITDLLDRSRDLRLLSLEAQFQVLGGQLAGFADCVAAMAQLLDQRWDTVHPQAGDDPTDRRNTLELLDSRATVVLPLENVPLFRDRRLEHVTWRDYAVGTGKREPRNEDDTGDAAAILSAMKSADNAEAVAAAYEAISGIMENIGKISDACRTTETNPFSPNLRALTEVLNEMIALFAEARPDLTGDLPDAPPEPEVDQPGEDGPDPTDENTNAPAAAPAPTGGSSIATHAAAIAALTAVEGYFARAEPSAPSYLLVRQARQLIGRPLIEALELLLPEMADRAKIDFGSDTGFVMTMDRMRALSDGLPTTSGNGEETPAMTADTRDQAAALMSAVESFFRQTEPSSPIPVLLFKAKTYLNRDFSSIIGDLFPPSQ